MELKHTAQEWLAVAQAQLAGGSPAAAQAILTRALAEHPGARELRRARAGLLQQLGHTSESESLLRDLLDSDPGDVAAAFTLARMLQERGRMAAAASILLTCFAQTSNRADANLAIDAIELLDDCDRKSDAASIAAAALEANPRDSRLHAYAGMLQIQLGAFDRARQHYLFALEHDPRALEWHIPIGLASAQRYADRAHPDFALFRNGLIHPDLSEPARAELHFALGKAYDDIGDYAKAAQNFRTGNAIRKLDSAWSRKAWRRTVEARLAARSVARPLQPSPDFTPLFIVGMPRSGTTLLAGQLSCYPGVRNRGELPWIAKLSQQSELAAESDHAALTRAATFYAAQARRDDAGDARWFLDKQPLNFRYVDLILAMFPHAQIVYCVREPRDTALSLWMQCFLEAVQGYSYDFADIALVMRDCERLMARWHVQYQGSIRTVRYEDLVTSPRETVAALAEWIGIPNDADSRSAPAATTTGTAISTASLWQARQPVNTRSVLRWKNYVQFVPELLNLPNVSQSF